jgi:hypothetical protein
MSKGKWIVGLACLFTTIPALAYIGPGAGISFIGSLFSTLMIVVLAVGAILMWPLRYMWRRVCRLMREAKGIDEVQEASAQSQPNEAPSQLTQESNSV